MTDVEIERLRKVAWGVVANAGRLSPKRKPRWSHVMDATGQGSTMSRQLCADRGFDPEEVVGGHGCRCTSGALTPEDTCPTHGSECAQCAEYAEEIEGYEAAIEENLPEYVLDDGTEEPANYVERIEYAGGDAKYWLRVKEVFFAALDVVEAAREDHRLSHFIAAYDKAVKARFKEPLLNLDG